MLHSTICDLQFLSLLILSTLQLGSFLTISLKVSGSRPQAQITMPRLPKLIMDSGTSSQISALSIFHTFQTLLLVALLTNTIAAALPSSDITTRQPPASVYPETCEEIELCLFPDPNNCHNFIQCAADVLGTIEYILPCPLTFNGQLEWNQDKKECVKPKDSTCPTMRRRGRDDSDTTAFSSPEIVQH
jgi:hypothetical protein